MSANQQRAKNERQRTKDKGPRTSANVHLFRMAERNETVGTNGTSGTLFHMTIGIRQLGCGKKRKIPRISKKCYFSTHFPEIGLDSVVHPTQRHQGTKNNEQKLGRENDRGRRSLNDSPRRANRTTWDKAAGRPVSCPGLMDLCALGVFVALC